MEIWNENGKVEVYIEVRGGVATAVAGAAGGATAATAGAAGGAAVGGGDELRTLGRKA